MSELLPADYAIFALAAVLAVTGLFRGLSGMVAFLAGSVAAALTATAAWDVSTAYLDSLWQRALAALVLALLAFGLARAAFAKFIHVLVSQPGDSILGFLSGAAVGLSAFAFWAAAGMWLEHSHVASLLNAAF
ncbi:MAG: hypothetical protein J5807_02715 [Kiritimatiellae bacterium]|nr:hypothetical protein [Kiritimatiellia bacterium]